MVIFSQETIVMLHILELKTLTSTTHVLFTEQRAPISILSKIKGDGKKKNK